jgi:hypothetical protein
VADGLHLRVFVQGLFVLGGRRLEVEHDPYPFTVPVKG